MCFGSQTAKPATGASRIQRPTAGQAEYLNQLLEEFTLRVRIPLTIYINICIHIYSAICMYVFLYLYWTNRLPPQLAKGGTRWDQWCSYVSVSAVFSVCIDPWGQLYVYVHIYTCCMRVFVCVPMGNTCSASLLARPGDMKLNQPCLWQATGFHISQTISTGTHFFQKTARTVWCLQNGF